MELTIEKYVKKYNQNHTVFNQTKLSSKTLYLPHVNSSTTVKEIVQDLSEIEFYNQNEKRIFIFKWKHSERLLPPKEQPLKLSKLFKNQKEIKFILRVF